MTQPLVLVMLMGEKSLQAAGNFPISDLFVQLDAELARRGSESHHRHQKSRDTPRGAYHIAGFAYHKKQICRGDQWSPAGVQ